MSLRITNGWAALCVAAFLLFGCSENPVSMIEEETDSNQPPYDYIVPDLSDDMVLGAGQTIFIESEAMSIRFAGVVSDSRCPVGVVCCWEGIALVEFEFEKLLGDCDATIAEIRPGKDACTEPEEYASCIGYRLYLLSLDPYPVHGQEIDPGEYTVMIRVVPEE